MLFSFLRTSTDHSVIGVASEEGQGSPASIADQNLHPQAIDIGIRGVGRVLFIQPTGFVLAVPIIIEVPVPLFNTPKGIEFFFGLNWTLGYFLSFSPLVIDIFPTDRNQIELNRGLIALTGI